MRFLFLLFLWANAYADFSSMGEVALEYRQFEDDNKTSTIDRGMAVFSRLESRYEDEMYSHVLRGFARIDSEENSRNLVWLEDAYAAYFLDVEKLWRLSGGYKIFNWTALEAFRPADTVNSRNFDAPFERPEKRGELALELEMPLYEGNLIFSFFPRVEKPHYPGAASRLGLGVNLAEARFVDGNEVTDEQMQTQYAVKLNQFIYGADISLHFLHHYDRQFPIVGTANYANVLGNIVPVNGTASMNVPHYYKVTQYGGTFSLPFFDSWIFKLEGVRRNFEEELSILTVTGLKKPVDHSEVAMGLEYGTSHEDGSESTWFFEGVRILEADKAERAALGVFQSDVFIGLRHARNDVMGTEFLVTAIFDTERTHERIYHAQVSRRLSDVWKVTGMLRVFDAKPETAIPVGLEILNRDNHAAITLSRFF